MSNLTILSDAELDVVSGGILNGGAGGSGGNGGAGGNNGAVLGNNNSDFDSANLSVNSSTGNANGGRGGNGGDVSIRVSLGSSHRR